MRLIFGQDCDGRAYPDFPGDGAGALSCEVVGPHGLVTMLGIHLGLTGPQEPAAVRIAAYAAKLRDALSSSNSPFFVSSFTRDPWGTAEALLAWRDQLVAAGWNGSAIGSARLDDLAHVESQATALPPGHSDRLQAVQRALSARPGLAVERLNLVEPRDCLTPPYRRLVDAIGACGVEIVEMPTAIGAAGDLDQVQAFLSEGASPALSGDGSFVSVAADTALMAAETLADWVAAGTEEALSGTVVLCSDGDTAMLDRVFQSRGLPALGQSAASAWRGALQVLPLAFAARWAPFNAKALLDLLLLPRPPIAPSAARRLVRALVREPGTGGEAWERAWSDIHARLSDRFAEDPEAESKIADRLNRWRDWTMGDLYDRGEGMPAAAAKGIAARVSQWAFETDAGDGDPLLLSVADAAGTLAKAIDLLNLERLPALLVERIIDQVLADGAQNPNHVATAGGLRCVRRPAAIWGPVARLIWWEFTGPGDRVATNPWSQSEQAALVAAGCALERRADAAARIEWSHANPIHRTTEQVILIRPALAAGEETVSHPLAHRLGPLLQSAGDKLRWPAEQLLTDRSHQLAGRHLQRERADLMPAPQPKGSWTLPASAIGKLAGRRESATSFERLVDCQLRWVLIDVLQLSTGRFAEIPGPDQLLGNLAHEIANQVLQPGPVADPSEVRRQADAVFETLLSAIAAPLQQPEFAGELANARVRVPAALAGCGKMCLWAPFPARRSRNSAAWRGYGPLF